MAAWRKNCAKGDEKVFAKRLQWDGLDRAPRPGPGRASPAGKPRVAVLGAVTGTDDRVLPGTLGRSAPEERPGFHSGGATRRLRRAFSSLPPARPRNTAEGDRGRLFLVSGGGPSAVGANPCCFPWRRSRQRRWIWNSRGSAQVLVTPLLIQEGWRAQRRGGYLPKTLKSQLSTTPYPLPATLRILPALARRRGTPPPLSGISGSSEIPGHPALHVGGCGAGVSPSPGSRPGGTRNSLQPRPAAGARDQAGPWLVGPAPGGTHGATSALCRRLQADLQTQDDRGRGRLLEFARLDQP